MVDENISIHQSKYGYFINPDGCDLRPDAEKSTWWTEIYEFTLDLTNPLTYIDADGNKWQPNRHYHTDMGSVPRWPPFLRMFVPRDRFLGFYFHDSGYTFGGLYKNGEFVKMTRKEIDDLLFNMCMADPCSPFRITASSVWEQVRLWGWAAGYGKGDAK